MSNTSEEIKEYNRIISGRVLDNYTADNLPPYEACITVIGNEKYRKKNGDYQPDGEHLLDRHPTELERFIYEETPPETEVYFRERLAKLLNWHRQASNSLSLQTIAEKEKELSEVKKWVEVQREVVKAKDEEIKILITEREEALVANNRLSQQLNKYREALEKHWRR